MQTGVKGGVPPFDSVIRSWKTLLDPILDIPMFNSDSWRQTPSSAHWSYKNACTLWKSLGINFYQCTCAQNTGKGLQEHQVFDCRAIRNSPQLHELGRTPKQSKLDWTIGRYCHFCTALQGLAFVSYAIRLGRDGTDNPEIKIWKYFHDFTKDPDLLSFEHLGRRWRRRYSWQFQSQTSCFVAASNFVWVRALVAKLGGNRFEFETT